MQAMLLFESALLKLLNDHPAQAAANSIEIQAILQ
jgi:hypothetical protein